MAPRSAWVGSKVHWWGAESMTDWGIQEISSWHVPPGHYGGEKKIDHAYSLRGPYTAPVGTSNSPWTSGEALTKLLFSSAEAVVKVNVSSSSFFKILKGILWAIPLFNYCGSL